MSEDTHHPFLRKNPFEKFEISSEGNLRTFITVLGKKLETEEVTDQELVQFFRSHKLVFHNTRTGMYSSDFSEREYSPDKVTWVGTVSCSCGCGPLDEECYQLGPGSKR